MHAMNKLESGNVQRTMAPKYIKVGIDTAPEAENCSQVKFYGFAIIYICICSHFP